MTAQRMPVSELLSKSPPHDLQAEQAVLGSILISERAIYESDTLSPSDFYDDANRVIFQSLQLIRDGGRKVDDVLVLADFLKSTGKWELVGGAAYLAKLSTATPSAANVKEYAKVVRDHAKNRAIIMAAREAMQRAYQLNDSQSIVDELDATIANIGIKEKGFSTTLREDGERRLREMHDANADGEDAFGHVVETGIEEIDSSYGGLSGGQSIVIAARPSDGKSALGKQIASNVAERGKISLVVSLEMESSEIADRVWSQRILLDGKYVQTGTMTEEEKLKLEQAVFAPGTENMHLSAPVGRDATWRRISGYATMLHATTGLDLLVLDYLQLVERTNERQSTYETVTEASRGAKALARKLKIPVVCLAQIGREADKGSRREPRLSDLRDSGSIEQDADVVMFLHRVEERGPEFRLIVAKWRNAELNSFPMVLDGKHTRFLSGEKTGF